MKAPSRQGGEVVRPPRAGRPWCALAVCDKNGLKGGRLKAYTWRKEDVVF